LRKRIMGVSASFSEAAFLQELTDGALLPV
jgi:hypothetical protein